MPWLTREGVRLYAERQGEVGQPPLLYISGTGQALAVRPNGFDLSFAGSFDLACYDQRGLGRSDHPRTSTGGAAWTMAAYGDDAAAVLDWAGWEQSAVMGVSFGGMVAQELLARHPDRVSRAVLACTSSGGPGGASYPLHELAAIPVAERVALQLGLIDTRWSDPSSPDPLRAMLADALAQSPAPDAGALAQLAARSRHDTWDRLSAFSAPVLVCAGRYDGLAPLANSEALAGQIPGARLEVFNGGHGFLYQDPSAPAVIREFLLTDADAVS